MKSLARLYLTFTFQESDNPKVLIQNNEKLTVMIEEDGSGFDIKNTSNGGKGLENVGFRIKEHLNGELTIDPAIGQGMIIMIKLKV